MRKVKFVLLCCLLGVYNLTKATSPIKNSVSGGYLGDLFTNLSGGIKSGSGYLGLGYLDLSLQLPNSILFFTKGVVTHGKTPSADYFGDRQVTTNIEAGNHIYIQELWLKFPIDNLCITAGLQDLNVDFMAVEGGGEFLNSSFGIPPISTEIHPVPIFPLTTLGVTVNWHINDDFIWKTGLYDGYQDDFEKNSHNLKWKFQKEEGFLLISQLALTFKEGTTLTPGVFYHSGKRGQEAKHHNYGVYLMGDFWKNEKFSLFSQVVLGSKQAKMFNPYMGFGLNYALNDNNLAGIAINHDGDWMNQQYDGETVIECYYKKSITENISIKPDIQYVINPLGTDVKLKNTLAGFVRMEINF
ncbi:MAG: carbohydrate porin [Tannerella sp.]|jgi:porin|nr:carbohydrate porin [Tannerella sp.]